MVRGLHERYGSQNIIELPDLGEAERYRGILEGWILSKTKSLMGNYYSTFTGNSCLRRNFKDCYYFRTWYPRLGVFAIHVSMIWIPSLLVGVGAVAQLLAYALHILSHMQRPDNQHYKLF
jgi:hypothetical protein